VEGDVQLAGDTNFVGYFDDDKKAARAYDSVIRPRAVSSLG